MIPRLAFLGLCLVVVAGCPNSPNRPDSPNSAQAPVASTSDVASDDSFLRPCIDRLEERLRTADSAKYLETRSTLKQYLMLRDVEHLDVDWATGRYAKLWLDLSSKRKQGENPSAVRPKLQQYFERLKRGEIEPVKLKDDLIEKVRARLQGVPIDVRYYGMIVLSLDDELIDEARAPKSDNKVFPPVQLPELFTQSPVAQKYFTSRTFKAGKGYTQVDGAFTDKGHAAVVKQIDGVDGLLRSESWVVAATKDETPESIPEHVRDVKIRYEREYVEAWRAFMADIEITTPADCPPSNAPPGSCGVPQAIDLYTALAQPGDASPHGILIGKLADQTQWRNTSPLADSDVNRRFNQRIGAYSGGIVVNVDLRELSKRMDKIPEAFRSTTRFIEHPKPTNGNSSRASTAFEYSEIMHRLAEKLQQETSKPRAKGAAPLRLADFADELRGARDKARALLRDYDATAVSILSPLLLMPLNVSGTDKP